MRWLLGTCGRLDQHNARCTCNRGYQNAIAGSGDPDLHHCVDIDECATNNGGCDPLTTCHNEPGGRTCGGCPPGYGGDGQTGCLKACASHPCQHGGSCTDLEGADYACACPPGINGKNCEVVFTELDGLHWGGMCGLRSDGKAACWGTQRGLVDHPLIGTFTSISAASEHLCGLDATGMVHCFGPDGVDDVPFQVMNVPGVPFDSIDIVDMNGGCGVLSSSKQIGCWGWKLHGSFDPMSMVEQFQSIATGFVHVCGIRLSDHEVDCRGSNQSGDDAGQSNPPPGPFQALTADLRATCGLKTDGTIRCWGNDSDRQPVTSPSGQYLSFDYATDYGCGIRMDQTLECWGTPHFGNPVTPPTGTFRKVATGYLPCAIRTDDSVVCWGADAARAIIPTNEP